MTRQTVETYGEAFEFDIHNILREGHLARRRLFEWWVGDGTVACARCEAEFSPSPDDVEEDDEILCSRCRGKKRKQR
jgi:hypothetical protein